MKTLLAVMLFCVSPSIIAGDRPEGGTDANPLSSHAMHMYDVGVRALVTRAAEQLPEEQYGFRPVSTVRTFGEIVAHITDSQYFFCSMVLGEKMPAESISGKGATRTQLITALKGALDYCARAHASLDDTTGAETILFSGSPTPKLGVLNVNTTHTIEHYGNLVTYLRMNGLVPPTSDPELMKSLRR